MLQHQAVATNNEIEITNHINTNNEEAGEQTKNEQKEKEIEDKIRKQIINNGFSKINQRTFRNKDDQKKIVQYLSNLPTDTYFDEITEDQFQTNLTENVDITFDERMCKEIPKIYISLANYSLCIKSIDYALDMLKHEHIYDSKSQLQQYLSTLTNQIKQMTERDFKNRIIQQLKCEDDEPMIKQICALYHYIMKYDLYMKTIQQLEKFNDPQNVKKYECNFDCCYTDLIMKQIEITNRRVSGNSIILYSNRENENKQIELAINHDNEVNPEQAILEISQSTYNITTKVQSLQRDDILKRAELDGHIYDLSDLLSNDVYDVIKYSPLPFSLFFERKHTKYKTYCGKCCKKNSNISGKSGKCDKCLSCLKHPIQILLSWIAKFIKLSLAIVSKTSAVIDSVTDILLLYQASSNNAISFTILIFITLLAPYILSYSSGLQIFLYRKTFQNVELFTFRSLLLA
eukprot:318392_1